LNLGKRNIPSINAYGAKGSSRWGGLGARPRELEAGKCQNVLRMRGGVAFENVVDRKHITQLFHLAPN